MPGVNNTKAPRFFSCCVGLECGLFLISGNAQLLQRGRLHSALVWVLITDHQLIPDRHGKRSRQFKPKLPIAFHNKGRQLDSLSNKSLFLSRRVRLHLNMFNSINSIESQTSTIVQLIALPRGSVQITNKHRWAALEQHSHSILVLIGLLRREAYKTLAKYS